MRRREFLKLAENFFISLFGIVLPYGCGGLWWSKTSSTAQLAFLLGYLLYGDDLPVKEVGEIEKYLETRAQNSLTTKLEFDQLRLRLDINKGKSFQTLSSQNKKVFFKQVMPVLVESPGIIDVLQKYLQEGHALKYLAYPDLPGEFGVCGWLIIEGDVWDRYYPSSGS